ncbi:MAG: hypothetical protein EA422_04570 [Gemmatimonadales bacterium]|nr:MAG: hypothetical protein EA422_04570 [Gemmatimonadales bacterium]
MSRVWGELTWPEAARLAASDPVVLWTVSATEQHGPHLPLSTDAVIAAGLVSEAERHLPSQFPLVHLPALEVGASLEHEGFPGTLSVPAHLLTDWVVRMGRRLAASGGRRLVILNTHGGNRHALEGAALRLRAEAGLLVIPVHYPRFGRPPSVELPDGEWRHGLHGGAVETAMMLHLRPDLVRTDELRPGPSLAQELEASLEIVSAEGAAGFAWLAGDLNPLGFTGDATLADAAMGRTMVEFWGARLAAVLRDARAFPLDRLEGRRAPLDGSRSSDAGPGVALGTGPARGAPADDPLSELFLPLMADARFVVGQLGQGLDGRIATEEGHSHYVTGEEDLVRLHRLRALVDAVVVGAGTALSDDPRLTVRRVPGSNPVRVVLDPRCRLPETLRIFRDGAAPTLHLVAAEDDGGEGASPGRHRAPAASVETSGGSREPGVERVSLPTDADGRFDPGEVIRVLRARGLSRILVEGGGTTVSHFLEAGALDRLHVTVAPLLMGSGRPALTLPPIRRMEGALRPRTRIFRLGSDVLFDLDLRSGASNHQG